MSSRVRNYDIIRVIGILEVICIHSLMPLRDALTSAPSLYHWICAFYDSMVNTGVPLFVMLSGALLLGRQESWQTFYRKRLRRLLVPFLIWSVLVYTMSAFLQPWEGWVTCLKEFAIQFCTTGVNRAYWFVYMLLGLYLITPLLQYLMRHLSKTGIILLLVVLFCLYRVPKLPFVWYFMTGYVLTHRVNIPRTYAAIGMLAGVILQTMSYVYAWYPLPWPMLIATCMFALLTQPRILSEQHDAITFVSTNSYGIYLSHVIFCGVLLRLPVYTNHIPLWLLPMATTIIVFAVEYALMHVLHKLHLDTYLC